ncbi:MAG: hypothetical protein PHD96_01705 [Candidatus Pacebacteria bacterium]|nr:hypothetical protein [Candidatus Paceibacterota bacterium]
MMMKKKNPIKNIKERRGKMICKHYDNEIDFVAEIRVELTELKSKKSINFLLFQCRNCKEFLSFPKGKLKTVLKSGTPKTLDLLRSYGVPVDDKDRN